MPGLRKSSDFESARAAESAVQPSRDHVALSLGPHERTPSWEGQDVFTVCDVPPFPKSLTPTLPNPVDTHEILSKGGGSGRWDLFNCGLEQVGRKKDLPARGEEVHSFLVLV